MSAFGTRQRGTADAEITVPSAENPHLLNVRSFRPGVITIELCVPSLLPGILVRVFADLSLKGRPLHTDGTVYKKRSLTKRVRVHRGKTENGSIESTAQGYLRTIKLYHKLIHISKLFSCNI